MPFVCLIVCLSVCLLATLRKATERVFVKMYDVSVDKEELIKCRKLSSSGSIQDVFEGFFNIARSVSYTHLTLPTKRIV